MELCVYYNKTDFYFYQHLFKVLFKVFICMGLSDNNLFLNISVIIYFMRKNILIYLFQIHALELQVNLYP